MASSFPSKASRSGGAQTPVVYLGVGLALLAGVGVWIGTVRHEPVAARNTPCHGSCRKQWNPCRHRAAFPQCSIVQPVSRRGAGNEIRHGGTVFLRGQSGRTDADTGACRGCDGSKGDCSRRGLSTRVAIPEALPLRWRRQIIAIRRHIRCVAGVRATTRPVALASV